ncbi:hypothetical protein CC80DRAFT_44352 [Byssothecium circinans]|uniref:Myb-like domain-containing protein n=1 Tax=Byssothecium circinans TaxID=147558 RepID=A0A6A5U8I1_9PLEO|nr:hypothetical protein CC80DRAFT_44352 [Byssothecium circinans]
MSSARYTDGRYPRDRSPYRDRRPSTYGSGYPPRASDSTSRPNGDQGGFASRDPPRGPKSHADPPRGPPAGPSNGPPSAPRDGRGRGFGRGEAPSLRDAPPLSSVAHPQHHPHNSWRADRDRDRDFDRDRRDRRPSPPRRSPIRDTRDGRDQRDFPPRDLDINRARRNSRDGPPSAGSTYSDPPLVAGSSYRGSGIGRGRGGRDFHNDMRGRGRNFHNDDRDRHHDARDRIPDRSYRPRSRSRDPMRRERDARDIRDERDFDRRDRDERRFAPREYDSYIGPAATGKPGPRGLDTHRGSVALDSRHLPGTPTSAASHPIHHSPADRLGPSLDAFSRRSSVATEPSNTKREPGRDDLMLAGRAEASKERYAPRASSPPAAVPAFGFSSHVWRNPALDVKPSAQSQAPKLASVVPTVAPQTGSTTSAPVNSAPVTSAGPKTSLLSGLSTAPPTGPKADRPPERAPADTQHQTSVSEDKPVPAEKIRNEPRPAPVPPFQSPSLVSANQERQEIKHSNLALSTVHARANSPPQGPSARNRPPPTGPQAAIRANASPSFPRPALLPYAARDAPRDSSPSAVMPPMGSRNSNMGGHASSASTSPTALPANIPTGPKAARANVMSSRPLGMYPPPDRPGFGPPRMSLGVAPKSNQWVRPGLNLSGRPSIPAKREFQMDERDRPFGTAPKAPKLESNSFAATTMRAEPAQSTSASIFRQPTEAALTRGRAVSAEVRREASLKPDPIQTRRLSDVPMGDASPLKEKPPVSATSSAPEVMQDSDDEIDLDDADFAESEAKYNREKALLESKRIDLSASHLRATTPLSEIMLLASLTIDHLPRQETKSVEEERASVPPVEAPCPESTAAELPTPKAEEPEDVVMEDKEEKQLAPATRALRLRQGANEELEEEPDLSSLPYLGSGPPTPISELEGPRMDESVMHAIRDSLRKTIEPKLSPEETLEQYAAAYRQWRLYARELDDARYGDGQERQPSAEPSVRVTTPDVTSTATGPLLDSSTAGTGRRAHSSRWATDLDIEHVIKLSLRTAEEERMGKKEKEPRRSMADPEREATVPTELTAYEVQRRRFIDTNFQREPGQGLFVFHYEPPEDDFTPEEHKIMVQHYRDQYAKKWGKLAETLYKEAGTSRTYKDCINHYYATKWGREYKGKVRGKRGGPRKRGGGVGRGRGAIANMDRPENQGDDGLPPALTETGRPRRSAAPTFGAETDIDTNTSTPTPGRLRRPTDADSTQDKPSRRGKATKERGGRKAKAQPLGAAPAGSPIKIDRKSLGVKMEDEFGKHPLGEMPLPMQPQMLDEHMALLGDPQFPAGMIPSMSERPRLQPSSRPGPSSYWSVTEQTDFQKNVAHFGTDWAAIAMHMGTKTQTMVKNQYLRLIEGGQAPDLERMANEADGKRHRGEDLGPPPTPTPAPKRRYETTQAPLPRTLAPTPEATIPPVMALSKASPPSSNLPRYSNIAQAPQEGKPAYTVQDPGLASIPSIPPQQQQQQQQSPPVQPLRGPSHHSQHLSQSETRRHGPPVGYFSQDFPQRRDHRTVSQSANMPPTSRPLQPQVQSQLRTHEQPHAPFFRPSSLQEREALARVDQQQEYEAQLRFQAQHNRRSSGEGGIARQYPHPGTLPQMRGAQGARSPEHRSTSQQHRATQQPQPIAQQLADASVQPPSSLPPSQHLPPRSAMSTPPVKEEPRHYPVPNTASTQQASQAPAQPPGYSLLSQPAPQTTPAPPAPKPAPEPRKSNLLSLLNDTEPEEPRRKKPTESSVPSHTPTPQQQIPIAPPPPPAVSQALPPQRDYRDTAISQAPFGRASYAQQAALPQLPASRQVVDLTNEQGVGGRAPQREGWRPQYSGQGQPQQPPTHNSPHTSLAQLANHRSVFAQHNNHRYNPSPPPLSAYNNSPHLHSRTPSLSGPPGQPSRHGLSASTAAQHAQTSSSQILQPNPYAQVDPPGSGAQPPGPVGMQPSPHLHMSHLASQREQLHSRNEHSRGHNGGLPYSNPQTPSEHHPPSQHLRGHSIVDPYRGRDPRDLHHEFDPRNPERDMSRELAHQTNQLRDAYQARSSGPPQSHPDARYAPQQERGYPSQRSQTPLSRSDHGQAPPLQHPPQSSLGDSYSLFGQRQEDAHRFRESFSRDNRIVDRLREEQAQQHAALSREDSYVQREREMREREMREREREMREREMRDAQLRETLMRRGAPPPSLPPGPGSGQEQRGGPPPTQPMDWSRHPSQQQQQPPQERWNR